MQGAVRNRHAFTEHGIAQRHIRIRPDGRRSQALDCRKTVQSSLYAFSQAYSSRCPAGPAITRHENSANRELPCRV